MTQNVDQQAEKSPLNSLSILVVALLLLGIVSWHMVRSFGLYGRVKDLTSYPPSSACDTRELALSDIIAQGLKTPPNGHGYFTGSREHSVPSDELHLSGWALDLINKSPISCLVAFSAESDTPLPIKSFQKHFERSDVVTHFGDDEAYRRSGWKASLSIRNLREGSHSLSVYGLTSDGRFFSLLAGDGTVPEVFIPAKDSK